MAQLSVQARILWAKTGSCQRGESHLWGPLYVHMADSAEIARLLWRYWIPESVKHHIAAATDLCINDAELLVSGLAGFHDIGKASPSFQSKVQERAEAVRERGIFVPTHTVPNCSHASMGQVILMNWLIDMGFDYDIAMTYTSAVGGHHGMTPDEETIDEIAVINKIKPAELIGDNQWTSLQGELLDHVSTYSGFEGIANRIRSDLLSQSAQVLLTGIVIISDWIASNADLFPLTCDEVLGWEDCVNRAIAAFHNLDLPLPLELNSSPVDDEVLFHNRFARVPSDATLRSVQEISLRVAESMDNPGLIIIEAPMGCGKTEAALLCAEKLAEKFNCGGLAYLLPTMATSNAMFTRVSEWLRNLCEVTSADKQSLQLMHGKAELNDDFVRLRSWHSDWMGDDGARDETVIAHQWFSGRKRGLLASFVVGTIDQLMMAALKAKHVHLRHLGLAGKVVIIDEVHAYDAYMNVFLDRALQFLGAYGVPVILLSATLSQDRREALVKAYRMQNVRTQLPQAPRSSEGQPAYPIVTMAGHDKTHEPIYAMCETDDRVTDVVIEHMTDNEDALIELLHDALSEGGCACVVRNTVKRAQETYELLCNAMSIEVKLVHSRYIAFDRARNDAELLKLLGSDSLQRPNAIIVVGTQVIEQSLDIDFDIMVTDVAPMDLLLQRMGRLHRHERGHGQSQRPLKLRKARCIITGLENWDDTLPSLDAGVAAVYSPAILWQTIAILKQHETEIGESLRLPEDISTLVEGTYEGLECLSVDGHTSNNERFLEAVDEWKELIRSKERRAKNWILPKIKGSNTLNGWMHNRLDQSEDTYGRAAVRDGQESVEVIVVQKTGCGMCLLPRVAQAYCVCGYLGDDDNLPDEASARVAALCSVNLPPVLTQPWRLEKIITILEDASSISWQKSHWLKGLLPLVIDDYGDAEILCGSHTFMLHYSDEKGLEIVEREEDVHER